MDPMTIQPPDQHPSDPVPTGRFAAPLLPTDPPRIGDFWLDARLVAGPPGVAYQAHGPDSRGVQRQVMLVVLSDGAGHDAACRDRLAGEVNKLHIDTVVARGGRGQDEGRLGHRFVSDTSAPAAPDGSIQTPWVALAHDASDAAVEEGVRLLRCVDLSSTAPLGTPSGPDYRLHWIDEPRPGPWRAWPLPWPGRHDRAGWMSIAVSWLLMVLLAALALLIAVLLFQNKPPAPPPPPIPTSPPPSQSQSQSPPPSQSPTSAPPSSASPSQGSGSPSPSSASPSPASGSPDPSRSASAQPTTPSDRPSMESPMPSGSASGDAGTPTPNRRL
ncbi:hypothetical protein GCM10027030_20010 [Luteococcus sediminum]